MSKTRSTKSNPSPEEPVYEDLPHAGVDPLAADEDWLEPPFPDEPPPGWEDDFPPDEGSGDDARHRQHHPSRLEETDLAHFFGSEGPLAGQLAGYELRPSQLQMAQAVKEAIAQRTTALIEAPTGTGKSIAYLLPALLSGRTVIVATANKSLQSQLYRKDIPFLAQVLGRPIPAVMVKGRSNYLCPYKWEKELGQQERFVIQEGGEDEQITFLREWATSTETGDVDDLPFEINLNIRPHVVSFTDDCIQRQCQYFYQGCFVNQMRDRAANAQVLITNHHLLLTALQLEEMGYRLLPPGSIYVIDEAHQLEDTATAVFEVEVTNYAVEQLLSRNIFKEHARAETIDELRFQNSLAFQEAELQGKGEQTFRLAADLEEMARLSTGLVELHKQMSQNHPYRKDEKLTKQEAESRAEQAAHYDLALEALGSLATKLAVLASSKRDSELVRFAQFNPDRRHVRLILHAAPIDPAAPLREFLFSLEKCTIVCTSATLATAGHFEHFKRRCGIDGPTIERALPPVFDYPSQAMLYQPPLPAYDWRNKDSYYDAVAGEIERLLEVSRGRALCLFTNWSGLQQVRDRLADPDRGVIWPLRAQGEGARSALLDWFVQTPHSVLLATRSFWEGIDLPGEDLSLVVLDKMPFPTPNDPIHSARMARLEEAADRSSFGDYMLPLMTLTLKQGFGRLVRRATDRGVVAILDERLSSKGYGRQSRQDLPPARFSRAFGEVHHFFRAALNSRADFALNVQAWPVPKGAAWRWHLLRMQDGKADNGAGQIKQGDLAQAEITAAIAGLADLKERIDRAGRKPNSFGVELRCSRATEETLAGGDLPAPLQKKWINACAVWGAIHVLSVTQ
jgi:ATP-dependent DNA helicase DinG